MINMKTKTFTYSLLSIACLVTAPVMATAQDSSAFPTQFIDVFQDGTLYITYEEYLERQRRVEAAQAAARSASSAAPARRAPVATAQVARDTNVMSLRNQWTIGAFR